MRRNNGDRKKGRTEYIRGTVVAIVIVWSEEGKKGKEREDGNE